MQTELTLMAVPTRNISLPTLRKHVEQRMMQNLNVLTNNQVDAKDEEALKQLCGTLDSKSSASSAALIHCCQTALCLNSALVMLTLATCCSVPATLLVYI